MGAVGVSVRLLGAVSSSDHWIAVPVLGAFPWFVLWSVVTATVVTVTWRRGRQRGPVVAAALLAAGVGTSLLVPRMVAVDQPAAMGEVVTVAAVNVRMGAADTDRIATLALDLDVDLLAVVESTPSSSTALHEGPLGTVLSSHENATTEVGGIVLARGDVVPLAGLPHAGGTPDVLWTTPAGTEVEVTTVHASAPIGPVATDRWRVGLARTPVPGERPALVLGDLNATIDHATLRGVLARGWRDAALEVGEGLSPTYDGWLDGSPGLPMTIDHALVSPDVAVRSFTVHDVPGTDHRLIVTTLQLP